MTATGRDETKTNPPPESGNDRPGQPAAASPSDDEAAANDPVDIPVAALEPERRVSWLWIMPLLAAGFVAWIAYGAWSQRGVLITVQLDRGHGLEPAAEVRHRGIAVGRVESVALNEGLDGILVSARLNPEAEHLARAGTRIWVVRPKLGISGVVGLETVVGPRYLAILPGDGPPQQHFVGLNEQPILMDVQPGDLDVILQTNRKGSLRPGAPILYRQVPVGVILSVGLTGDGGAVEARAHIHKAYAQLVRPETRFWNAGGVEAKMSIRGLSLSMESVESLVIGGVALATPPNAGEMVRTGHRFELVAKPQEDWLNWQPLVVIGSSLLPPGAPMPSPMRATLGGTKGRIFKSERFYRGWVLQTERGLLGPAELLDPSENLNRDTVVLEVAGDTVPLTGDPIWSSGGIAILDVSVTRNIWPADLRRVPTAPEDCLVVADSGGTPLPLVATRLSAGEQGWKIDPAVAVDASLHGACVLARSDGKLVGIVLVEKDIARVALLGEASAGHE
ncbi:MAG: MlaD family protein [Planctomycetota bacterium]|nr:MlaD family protein [Planctomycetota bacterium]